MNSFCNFYEISDDAVITATCKIEDIEGDGWQIHDTFLENMSNDGAVTWRSAIEVEAEGAGRIMVYEYEAGAGGHGLFGLEVVEA